MSKKSISDLNLEKYILGELEAKSREEVNRLIEKDASLANRVSLMQKENERFFAHYPYSELKNKLGIQPKTEKKRAFTWIYSGVGLALATLLFTFNLKHQEPLENNIIKGLSPSLSVYLHVGSEVRKVNSGEQIPKGAEIQLSYIAASKKYGAVISIDSTGKQTWHLPERPSKLVKLNQDGETALPIAFALDDTPYFEKFILLTADTEQDLIPYLAGWKVANSAAAETFWEHPLPSQIQTYEFTLKK